jgi:hypothetical protein
MADIGAKVAAKLGKITLLSISLTFELSGPAQWNAKGKAEFKILFIKFKVNFNKTWGKSAAIENKQIIVLLPQFRDNYLDKNNRNWRITSGNLVDGLVETIKFDDNELIMQPSDRISFSQDLLPLDKDMVRYGEAIPDDVKRIELKNLTINNSAEPMAKSDWEQTTSFFAPTLINKLGDNEKLKARSFEKMNAGFSLTASLNEENGGSGTYGTGNTQEIDNMDWKCWTDYLEWIEMQKQGTQSAPPQSGAQTAQAIQLVSQIVAGTNMGLYYSSGSSILYKQTAGLRQLSAKLKKVTPAKPSLRRTDVGFKRHTLGVESKLYRKVDNLIDLLDSKIIKK